MIGLNEDQRQFFETSRAFSENELAPIMQELDMKESDLPRPVLEKAAQLGFGGIYTSTKYGGTGLNRLDASLIFEALSAGDVSTTAYISIHNMCAWMIDAFGSTKLKETYLPDIVKMKSLASYCLTEPGAGSDAASLSSTAKLDGQDYILSGSKAFISGGGQSDIYIVMARDSATANNSISCFLIDARENPKGLSFGKKEKKLGWNSQPTRAVIFDQVRIPKERLVGTPGHGFKYALAGLDGGRINIASCSLGGAHSALAESLEYVSVRKQFGKALQEFQVSSPIFLVDILFRISSAYFTICNSAKTILVY
jgi:isobutyryl-CoA dehydrogenase